MNKHIKTIANMAFTTRLNHTHFPVYALGYHAVAPNGTRVDGPFNPHIDYSRLALNHYYTKSFEVGCTSTLHTSSPLSLSWQHQGGGWVHSTLPVSACPP